MVPVLMSLRFRMFVKKSHLFFPLDGIPSHYYFQNCISDLKAMMPHFLHESYLKEMNKT